MNNAGQKLMEMANKPKGDSKKFKMTETALYMVCAIVFLSFASALFRPELASTNLITVVQAAITAIGSIVAVYSGAQASVDWRNSAALESIHNVQEEHKTEDVHIVQEIKEEGSPGVPTLKPFYPHAEDDKDYV